MRLQRIYSSKIYLTSSRKDKIHAAIADPINAELVRQLSDYLDDDAKVELKQALDQEKAKEDKAAGTESDGAPTSDGADFIPSSHGGGAGFTGDIMNDFGDDDLADVEPLDIGAESAPDTDMAASKKVKGTAIKATSSILTTFEDLANECETIKATLNVKEETSGASRLQVKENELWIYYNDDVNLNDKMIDVIETLNSTGYTYLAFSRLARGNNAIVFDINLNINEPVKPESELDK